MSRPRDGRRGAAPEVLWSFSTRADDVARDGAEGPTGDPRPSRDPGSTNLNYI